MGRRGPKPIPKAIRLLRNLPAGARIPRPAVSDPPVMPAGLSDDEAACWRGLVEELEAVPGLLTRADRGVVEMVARLEPMLRTAAVVVREQGSTLQCFDAEGRLKFCQTRPEATFVLKAG